MCQDMSQEVGGVAADSQQPPSLLTVPQHHLRVLEAHLAKRLATPHQKRGKQAGFEVRLRWGPAL